MWSANCVQMVIIIKGYSITANVNRAHLIVLLTLFQLKASC